METNLVLFADMYLSGVPEGITKGETAILLTAEVYQHIVMKLFVVDVGVVLNSSASRLVGCKIQCRFSSINSGHITISNLRHHFDMSKSRSKINPLLLSSEIVAK